MAQIKNVLEKMNAIVSKACEQNIIEHQHQKKFASLNKLKKKHGSNI